MLVSLSLLAIPSASVMIALHLKLSTSKSVIVLLSAFNVLFVSVFVLDTVGITTPSTANTQALLLDNVVSEACHTLIAVNCGESPVANPSVVLTCAGVLLAHALETATIKLFVVAVSQASVVKSESRGCLLFNCVCIALVTPFP